MVAFWWSSVPRSCLVMGVRIAIIVRAGATAHLASCKAVAAVEGDTDNYCVLAHDATLTAEDCWCWLVGGGRWLEGVAGWRWPAG